MERDRVLVTDGETRAALAIVRSLGRAGYAVHVASEAGRSLAGASRFCGADHALGDASREPMRWAARIEDLARRLDALVLPVTEVAIGSLFAARADERIRLVAPPRPDYEAAVDKFGLVERGRKLGLDVPRTILLSATAPEPVLGELAYPLVAKPRRSRVLTETGWLAPDVAILRSPAELDTLLRRRSPSAGDLLLQEFVPGHGEGLFALCEIGEIRAHFAHRRIREKPPTGGVSVLRESIEPDPDLLAAGARLLGDLRYTGLAMVEFRRASDGRLALMEINPRPWGSLQLAIDAGVDFPRLAVETVLGRSVREAPMAVRIGVRTRWLLGDFDHWIICARSPALRRELGRSLASVTRDFVMSFFDGTRLEVLRRDDPRPFLRELWNWLRGQ